MWVRGNGAGTTETAILEAAKEWGIPPWQVEAECSRHWWQYWLMVRGIQGKHLKELENRDKRRGLGHGK